MAARKDSRLKTQHREAIKTSMIINRLTDHIDGEVEMSATQVSAGLGLLRKVLPDLKAMEHSGDPDNPVGVLPFEFVQPKPEASGEG